MCSKISLKSLLSCLTLFLFIHMIEARPRDFIDNSGPDISPQKPIFPSQTRTKRADYPNYNAQFAEGFSALKKLRNIFQSQTTTSTTTQRPQTKSSTEPDVLADVDPCPVLQILCFKDPEDYCSPYKWYCGKGAASDQATLVEKYVQCVLDLISGDTSSPTHRMICPPKPFRKTP